MNKGYPIILTAYLGWGLLPMTSIGVLFYITPTLMFLCGTLILGETFNLDKLVGFTGIWIGLALFSYGLLKDNHQIRSGIS